MLVVVVLRLRWYERKSSTMEEEGRHICVLTMLDSVIRKLRALHAEKSVVRPFLRSDPSCRPPQLVAPLLNPARNHRLRPDSGSANQSLLLSGAFGE